MKKQYSLGLAVVGLLALSLLMSADRVQPSPVNAAPSAVQAQSIDELSYSACNCTPGSNGSWGNSSGDPDGFVWDATTGSWRNNEPDGNVQLYCPIAYDWREPLGRIEIRVDVIDNHSGDEVRVDVFGQSATGNPAQLGTANTAVNEAGVRRELVVTVTPNADTRYIWLRVDVPDEAAGGQSGLLGYRVNRL
jgi:hypothetical protein